MKTKIIGFMSLGLAIILIAVTVAASSANAATSPNILVNRNLTVGSTGSDVVVLQGLLSEMGYLNVPPTVAFGYYGQLTKAAVAQYQASHNVSPTAGYFGPLTKTTLAFDLSSHGWLSLLGW